MKYSLISGLFKHQYYVWVAILQGEDFEWLTWPGRIFLLGLFFVLHTCGTQVATAFLRRATKTRLSLLGPRCSMVVLVTCCHLLSLCFRAKHTGSKRGFNIMATKISVGVWVGVRFIQLHLCGGSRQGQTPQTQPCGFIATRRVNSPEAPQKILQPQQLPAH